MNKDLEALEQLKMQHYIDGRLPLIDRVRFDLIEKSLKTLEIIKNKSVNVRNLIIYCFEMDDTYEEYVDAFNYNYNYWELGNELLTIEEYDLLKRCCYEKINL